jgi:hypothetical protein
MDHLTMLLLVKEQKSRWRVVLTPHLDLSSAEAKMGREEGKEKRAGLSEESGRNAQSASRWEGRASDLDVQSSKLTEEEEHEGTT